MPKSARKAVFLGPPTLTRRSIHESSDRKNCRSAPVYGELREPAGAAGEVLVQVEASALSHLTKAGASAQHGTVPVLNRNRFTN